MNQSDGFPERETNLESPEVSGTRLSFNVPESIEAHRVTEPPMFLTRIKFIYPKDAMDRTPSVLKYNVSKEDELIQRIVANSWIRELTVRINLRYKRFPKEEAKRLIISKNACCVAMIYVHRFYMIQSISRYPPIQLATAALFLAAKSEDCPKQLKHFVKPLWKVMFPTAEDPDSDEVEKVRELIIALETSLLCTLRFELEIVLPHLYIIRCEFSEDLKMKAYVMCNDLLQYTVASVLYDSKTMAAAVLLGAGAYSNVDVPALYGDKWYEKIDPGVKLDTLMEILDLLSYSYTHHKALFPSLKTSTGSSNTQLLKLDILKKLSPPRRRYPK